MMIPENLVLLGLGFLLGLEHALDVDHLVAVSSLITQKTRVLKAAMTGMIWGLGHTAVLLIVGMIILALRVSIPATVALSLELVVGAMIVILGINVLYHVFRRTEQDIHHTHIHMHLHGHDHDHHAHIHEHSHIELSHHSKEVHEHNHQPFIVGIIHGLAGSASLMLLILASIGSFWLGVSYIAVFGLGTMIAMALLAALMSLPFVFTSERFKDLNRNIRIAAGSFSIMFGLYLMYKIAFVEGLLF